MKYLNKIEKTELSFLKACLKVDPNERITSFEALRHPYLKQYSVEDIFLREETDLLENRKRSHPEISMAFKHSSAPKTTAFSTKKFSIQTMFSKELGKPNVYADIYTPRKAVGESSESLSKQETTKILPKLNVEKSLSLPKSHQKTNSLEIRINNVKTIYRNFPVKLREQK